MIAVGVHLIDPPRTPPVRDEQHAYWVDGERWPGVTTVLREGQCTDYDGVEPSVLARKAALGRAVHQATWFDDEGDLDEASIRPDVWPYLTAWRRYRRDSQFCPEAAEQIVASRQFRYGGTLDRVGHLPGIGPTIVDIKCVVRLQPSTGLQLAAYQHAAREMELFDAGTRVAVQLLPTGDYRVQRYDDVNDLAVFLYSLSCYQWRARHRLLGRRS